MSGTSNLSFYKKQKAILNNKYYNIIKWDVLDEIAECKIFKLVKRKVSDTKQKNILKFKKHYQKLYQTNVAANHEEENYDLKPLYLKIAFITTK